MSEKANWTLDVIKNGEKQKQNKKKKKKVYNINISAVFLYPQYGSDWMGTLGSPV